MPRTFPRGGGTKCARARHPAGAVWPPAVRVELRVARTMPTHADPPSSCPVAAGDGGWERTAWEWPWGRRSGLGDVIVLRLYVRSAWDGPGGDPDCGLGRGSTATPSRTRAQTVPARTAGTRSPEIESLPHFGCFSSRSSRTRARGGVASCAGDHPARPARYQRCGNNDGLDGFSFPPDSQSQSQTEAESEGEEAETEEKAWKMRKTCCVCWRVQED